MSESRVSIGQVKRDISDLVNRVAYGGERIVLTSRGKPKAVLISVEEYAKLQGQAGDPMARWKAWLAECTALQDEILARRGGRPVDTKAAWEDHEAELEARDERIVGG